MSVSRRTLLQRTILVMAACAAAPFPAWAAKKNSSANENVVDNAGLEHLNRSDFEAQIGSGFEATPTSKKSASLWLRLLAVSDLPALVPVNPASMDVPPKQKSAPIQTSGFMLSFLSTEPKPLLQDTFNFEHAVLGKFSLLLVPEGPGKQTYTAVINRLP